MPENFIKQNWFKLIIALAVIIIAGSVFLNNYAKENKDTRILEKDLSTIIKEWQPYVAYIECTFTRVDGSAYSRVAGSGTLIPGGLERLTSLKNSYSAGNFIFTNKHVVVSELKGMEYGPGSCKIYLNGSTYDYNRGDYRYVDIIAKKKEYGNPTIDWATFILSSNPENTSNFPVSKDIKICNGKPSIGDKIIILGYPGIGSSESITATEGIISGLEGDYYITSAKIEHGNSGGAAILVKDNCYLGIPTYAVSGTVESLGRILDVNEAINDFNYVYNSGK